MKKENYSKTDYFCMGIFSIVYYPLKAISSIVVCPIASLGKYAKENDNDFKD